MRKSFYRAVFASFLALFLFAGASCTIQFGTNSGDLSTDLTSEESNIQYEIYVLAVNSGYEGTYEQWLASIRGEAGVDGMTPELRFDSENGYIQWKYTDEDDSAWRDLISIEDIMGAPGTPGLSAYEIYCAAHPEYSGTEQEWLADLINGRLATRDIYTVTFDANGGSDVAPQLVVNGEKAVRPEAPTLIGYTLDGWYINVDEKWIFGGFPVTEDITLDAVYYYAIATPEQLVAISSDLPGVYKLEADIDLASAEWTPIGTNIAPFTGVFLGQGFIISNLAITVSQSYVGLFGYNGGTISDLCLNGVTINVSGPSGSNIYAGAFIGYNAGSVASLHTLGGSIDVLLGSSPLGYAGGLIGYQAIVSTLDDLSNNADIFGGGLAATGGLVGYFTHSSNNITLTNSDNTGSVDGSSSHVGGLFGFAERIAASYCHNTAGISGTTKVGGLVGDGYRASFIWCSNSGTISGSNSYIGGIIGTTVSTTSFQFTQNSGPITGVDYVGGMIGRGAGLSVNFSSNSAAIIGRNSTGGLVGFGHSTSLTNCRNTGLVTGQGAYVGGLIGSGYGQTIINNVTNAGQVSGSQLYVGGIIGYAEQVIITRAINSGGVSSNSYNTGGLIGGAVVPITVICSVNFGAVAATGSSGYYGGIAGYYPTATIQQTYYTGTIVSSGVIVTGTAAGTKVTDLSVMNLSFFTSQLGYNQNMWDFSMLDVPNGFYPTLVMPF